MVRFEQGRYDAALALMEQARSTPNRGGKLIGLAFDLGYVCACLCSGRVDDFSELDDRLEELAEGPWADHDFVLLIEPAIGHAIALSDGPSTARLLRIYENQSRLLQSAVYTEKLVMLRADVDAFQNSFKPL